MDAVLVAVCFEWMKENLYEQPEPVLNVGNQLFAAGLLMAAATKVQDAVDAAVAGDEAWSAKQATISALFYSKRGYSEPRLQISSP
jgi:hypothetical protein